MKNKAVSDNLAESSNAYGHHDISMRQFPFLNQTLTMSPAS